MRILLVSISLIGVGVGTLLTSAHAEEPADAGAVSAQTIKAYRTLNFGDDSNTVKRKMVDLFPADGKPLHGVGTKDGQLRHSETFWKSLFDSDAEYAPYRFQERTIEQPVAKMTLKVQAVSY